MLNKIIRSFLVLGLAGLFLLIAVKVLAQSNEPVTIVAFHQTGCPHCADQEKFFNDVLKKNYNVDIKIYDILNNPANIQLFQTMAKAYGHEIDGVPTVFIGDKVYSGHDGSIELAITDTVKECLANGCQSPLDKLKDYNPDTQPVSVDQKFKKIGYTVMIAIGILIIVIIAFTIKPKRKNI